MAQGRAADITTRHRHRHRRRSPHAASPNFARLVRAPAARTAMTLRVGGAVAEVHAGFDAALLRALIAAQEAPAS